MQYSDMAEVTMPTIKQVNTEPAGRRMDAWVHRFVMDEIECRIDNCGWPWVLSFVPTGLDAVMHYSTNIVNAMDVLCKSRKGLDFFMRGHGDEYRCHIYGRGSISGVGYGKTISEAICRAALLKRIGEGS